MAGSFLNSVAANLVSKVGEYLFAPIGRQFGYVLCYKSYVQDLQNGVEKLETARERVQHSVEEAENDGKSIHKDVENWLKTVEEETEKADDLLKIGASAKSGCFRGWLPNPVVRHPIGRKAKKMTPVIQRLHDESEKNIFQKVYYDSPPTGKVPAAASDARFVDNKEDVLESRAKIMEEVMKALVDEKVSVVGVWGPGGVGKSKLLDDVKKHGKPFDFIAMAKVSRNPNLKDIQRDIAHQLGLKLTIDEPDQVRASRLRKRLERGPNILIILDDLWKKLELKEIGIPCGDDKISGCKLLLTSRKRDILRTDMGTDREFRLNELEHGEARRLFERTVGDRVNDPDFKPLVDGVVEKYGGLPLLILSVAKRLKHGDMAQWRDASNNINLSDAKSIVELNYDDLEDERIRSLFLVSAIDSGRIFMRCSLGYCIGLGIYTNFKTIDIARDRWITDVHSLQDSSLLLDTDDVEEIYMHDIYVDVANSIASTQWNALVGREDYGFKEWSKDELIKCTAISFIWAGIDELPEKLDCPNLRMLLLSESNPSLKIPESFFESTEKLQVLDLTRLSFTSLPSSIEFLENLRSLYLDYCHLEDVTILGKLKGLQFLSFHGSAIDRLPKEIGGLTELRFLDLTECTGLKIIEPGVLGSLVNLEELYMEDSFDQWETEDKALQTNASLAELKKMKKLSTLYISIPHSAYLPRDLPFGKLNKHKIQIGDVWDWSGEYKESRTLKLKLDSGNLLLEEWVQECLQRTQDLHLDGLQDGIDSIHDLCDKEFQELKHLHVQNSPSFQYVVHSTENVQCNAFTRLESLFLENLNNLEKICCGYLAPESFSKLNIVKVDNCGEIKHLFPLPMKRTMSQIEEIEISRCHLMQHIVADVEANEDGDEIDDDKKVKSYNLCRLTLQDLPTMRSFCKTEDHSANFFDGQQLMKLQSLEAITIERCQLIREVFDLEGLTTSGEVEILLRLRELTLSDLPSLGRIWNKNPRIKLSFRNLRALRVQNCENLRYLFSSSMAKALAQIKEIEIANCKMMEEIMDVQEEELEQAATSDTIEFPMLTSLSLEELSNLRTFYSGKYRIHCPSLRSLRISKCPKMMTFSSYERKQQSMSTDTGFPQVFCGINSGLPSPVFFNERVHLPSVEELELSSMCELKRIWPNQLHGQSFRKLASLTVELCENLSHVFPSNSKDWLQSLDKLNVVGCPSLEELFEPASLDAEKRQKPLVLSALKKVMMLNLPKLRDITKSGCKLTLAFPSLMEVNVRHCPSLPYLFSTTTAKTLDKIEVLDVCCCNNMRSIIVMEEGVGKIMEKLKFRHLSTLKLGDLENLISFSSASCAGEGLHPLFDEKLAFPKLTSIRVEECPLLRNLFTMSLAKSLGQLQHLVLGGCGEMEYVVAGEEEKPEEVAHKIVILQFVTLYLHNMPKLRSFCQGMHISEWPSLKEFTIDDCQAVEVIIGVADFRKLMDNVATQQPLLLIEKVEFPSMESMKISHMNNVQKIWLDELPLNAFSKLKMLTVEYCEKLSSIFSSQSILARFQNLEKLVVTDCGSLEVVFQVHEFSFSEAHSMSNFQMREVDLIRLPNMKQLWSGLPRAALTFGKLQCLKAVECKSLQSLFPSSVAKNMTQLEKLEVGFCGVEEIIAEEDGGVGTSAEDLFFPRLTYLCLYDLPKLRGFHRNSHTSTWPLLKDLRVHHCGKMRSFSFSREIQSWQGTTVHEKQAALFCVEKVIAQLEILQLAREDVVMMPQHYIFGNLRELLLGCYHDENVAFPSDFLLQRFPNLETLWVDCSSFEEIFPECAFGHGGASVKSLGNLMRLRLINLPNLRRVWKDGSLMAEILKQIEFLRVWRCPSLLILLPSPASFQRLTELVVDGCAGLVHVGTRSAVTSLVQLITLMVRDCGAMEDVVTDDGNGVEEISFPKLRQLTLEGLPSLESFSPANCAFRFPLLVHVTVKQCPKMNTFCNGALRTPLLDKVRLYLEDGEGRWEGDLNTTIQNLST